MRIFKTLLFPVVIGLLLTGCSGKSKEILVCDFEEFSQYLYMPVSAICDSLTAKGYEVDAKSKTVAERDFDSYSMKATLVSDSGDIVDYIYLSYFPNDDDVKINNDAIESLVRHIGAERTLNNNSLCRFVMMTNSPDFAEDVLTTDYDSVFSCRDALDAPSSYDYCVTYYWLGTDEKIETIGQLYDYFYRRSETERPNEAAISIISSLRNTEFPRRQLTVSFSCHY